MKTTRESAREEGHKTVAQGLQELLQKNYDAEKDYRKARERAKNGSLKEFFKKQAVRRNHFATEIDKLLHSLNEHPKEKGTTLGGLHRTWINFRSSIEKDKDKVLLEESLRGEENSVEEYENKIHKTNFPAQIKEVLQNHVSEMRTTISEIESMKGLH